MPDDLQARLAQQLDDATHVCAGTSARPHRPTYMPVGREDGQRYCPVCAARKACEKKKRRSRKSGGAALPGVVDFGARPSGVGSTGPAAEHDAIGGGDDA